MLGLKRKEINALLTDIVEFAELEKFIDVPVKNYSNGMYIRLGFSVAVHVDPEILILDEVLSVGDESFQKKSRERIERFKEEGRTILFVSHDLESVTGLCDSAIWILDGEVKSVGPSQEVRTAIALTRPRFTLHHQILRQMMMLKDIRTSPHRSDQAPKFESLRIAFAADSDCGRSW